MQAVDATTTAECDQPPPSLPPPRRGSSSLERLGAKLRLRGGRLHQRNSKESTGEGEERESSSGATTTTMQNSSDLDPDGLASFSSKQAEGGVGAQKPPPLTSRLSSLRVSLRAEASGSSGAGRPPLFPAKTATTTTTTPTPTAMMMPQSPFAFQQPPQQPQPPPPLPPPRVPRIGARSDALLAELCKRAAAASRAEAARLREEAAEVLASGEVSRPSTAAAQERDDFFPLPGGCSGGTKGFGWGDTNLGGFGRPDGTGEVRTR